MPRNYKPDYLRELNDHRATKAKLAEAQKINVARDAELADLRRKRDTGAFATEAGKILEKAVASAVESLEKASTAAIKEFNALKASTLDELAAATTAEVVALREEVHDLTLKLSEATVARAEAEKAWNDAVAEIDLLKAKIAILEKHRANAFNRLIKHLPKGWEGQSLRALSAAGHINSINAFLAEAYQWVSDQAISNRPATPTVDPALNPIPEVPPTPTNAPITGMIR